MTEPTYHCKACKRRHIQGMLAVVDFHHKRKDRRLIAGIVAAAIVAALVVVGCVAGLLAVFG
jgi:hypothetical protein